MADVQMIQIVKNPPQTIRQSLAVKNQATTKFDSDSQTKKVTKYISAFRITLYTIIIGIGTFNLGYALSQFSTLSASQLKTIYKIQLSVNLTGSFLQGIMPIGGIIGALINPRLQKMFTRKVSFYVVSLNTLISTVFIMIPQAPTVFIGRFLFGISCGLYTSFGPLYVKQIVPKQLRASLGGYSALTRSVGVLVCFSLGYILRISQVPDYWYIVFAMAGLFALLQIILLFLFVPDSPIQMIRNDKLNDARQALHKIYKEQYVEQAFEQLYFDFQAQKNNQKSKKQQQDMLKQFVRYRKSRRNAFLMAINICVLRQLIGVNTLVAYTPRFMLIANPQLASISPVISNGLQGLATFIAIYTLSQRLGRRPLLLIATLTLGLSSFAIAITFIFLNPIGILITIIIYNIFFGLFMNPPSWPYPSQIIPASQIPFASAISWISIAITVMVPPLVLQAMPNHNPYPLFIFFGVYGIVTLIYLWFKLVESKGLTYDQILRQF